VPQKLRGPNGQTASLALVRRKTKMPSPMKPSGQCRPQPPRRAEPAIASRLMPRRKRPATLWLKLDQEYAATVRSPPTTASGSDVSASMVATDGVRRLGHLGAKTRATSDQAARSSTTSTAGGWDASVAAVKRISTANNVSPSTREGTVVTSRPSAPPARAACTARRFA
jgi:hypothetical protein